MWRQRSLYFFIIYGAVLEYSGAGKFFLIGPLRRWAAPRVGQAGAHGDSGRLFVGYSFRRAAACADTVTLGALALPMLKRSAYDMNTAGGILSSPVWARFSRRPPWALPPF